MPSIFGHLTLNDSDYVASLGSDVQVVYETANAYVARANAELQTSLGAFVARTTEAHARKFKLPGNGTLQRRGSNGRFGTVKGYGEWDVAFPIEDFGAQIAGNDVDMAYMRVGDLDTHIQTVVIQNRNTVRHELIRALLKKENRTFRDDRYGNLTVRALANTDGTLYPPLEGAEDPAEATHYLGLNYTAITDANNPFITASDLLMQTFGAASATKRHVSFVNRAQLASIRALESWRPVFHNNVIPGSASDVLINPPSVPGQIVGTVDDVWVSVWSGMPTGYIFSMDLDNEAPLERRKDEAASGLPDGLNLVATDEKMPFMGSFWRHRFGFGAGNRLNGVAMQLVASTTYSTPSIYA